VALPDTQRLLAIPEDLVRRFGERLRALGISTLAHKRFASTGSPMQDALEAPMRIWHARRMTSPAAVAVRAFLLHDPVRRDEAEGALGDLAPLIEGGLLAERDGGLVSPLEVVMSGDSFCFGDRITVGPAAVVPAGRATRYLLRAAHLPRAWYESVLNVGCGAGAVAIALSRAATRVVATDVDTRAVDYTRFNLRVAGVTNVEVRAGTLFEPVREERFRLLVAQPPTLAKRPGVTWGTFGHPKVRGDELALKLLGGVCDHLDELGRAVIAADWPVFDGDALDTRVRSALSGPRSNLTVFAAPAEHPDEYCTHQTAADCTRLDDAFMRNVVVQRDHFEAQRIRGVVFGVVVVELTASSPWTALVTVRPPAEEPVTAESVNRILTSLTLANGDFASLAEAKLSIPTGARLVRQPLLESALTGRAALVVMHPAPGMPEMRMMLEADAAAVVERIHAAGSVLAALAGMPQDAVTVARVEAVARAALKGGALQVAAAELPAVALGSSISSRASASSRVSKRTTRPSGR
jgi:methylase of polypeptide subunit release factors